VDGGGAFSALRAVRLLRVFKLARSWKTFRLLLEQMIVTLKDISTFAVLLLLCIFIFMLLGLEIFAHKIKFDGDGNPAQG
jgi:sterol desaturase/sphingolipid hydroxylase (fatty acid hydroxylase superfamily)